MRAVLLALGLAACGWTTPVDTGTSGAAFPHPDDYPSHGAEALADPDACAACHDPGTGPGAGPGCATCHAYPHDPTLVAGDVHGPAWLSDRTACADCHGTSGQAHPGGDPSGTCASCHHTFPHPPTFLALHGQAVVARGGAAACVSCHPAGDPGPGQCAACHDAYPHAPGVADPAIHGPAANASCTEGCHSSTDGQPPAGPTCQSCHDLYPHPEGWSRAHLTPVQARGEASCQGCHAPGTPEGPAVPVSCGASCHGGGE